MLTILRNLTILLNVALLSACAPVATPNESQILQQITPILPTPNNTYTRSSISCRVFINSRWGVGQEEFGFQNKSFSHDLRPGPYPPTFDERGNIFIADIMNERIIKYTLDEKPPKIIFIPDSFTIDFGSFDLPWSNISVSGDNVFFVAYAWKNERRTLKLVNISVKNGDMHLVDLDSYYPLNPTLITPVIADKHGGVYVLLEKGVIIHFNSNYQSEIILTSLQIPSDKLLVGWDGNLYTNEPLNNLSKNWGKANDTFAIKLGEAMSQIDTTKVTPSEANTNFDELLGVDSLGRLYFLLHNKDSKIELFRFDPSNNSGTLGQIDKPWTINNFGFSLAPDGSLYSTIFDPQNFSVQPKIIKCTF